MVSPAGGNDTCQIKLVSRWNLAIAVPIRDDFKRVLKEHLGKNWYQLATHMGLPKTPVDQIQEMADANLRSKITTFLDDYLFPGFRTDTETAQFLLEALQRTSLTAILEDVKRDLELVVNIQGTHSVFPAMLSSIPQATMFHAFLVFIARRPSISCTLCTKAGKIIFDFEHCLKHMEVQ